MLSSIRRRPPPSGLADVGDEARVDESGQAPPFAALLSGFAPCWRRSRATGVPRGPEGRAGAQLLALPRLATRGRRSSPVRRRPLAMRSLGAPALCGRSRGPSVTPLARFACSNQRLVPSFWTPVTALAGAVI